MESLNEFLRESLEKIFSESLYKFFYDFMKKFLKNRYNLRVTSLFKYLWFNLPTGTWPYLQQCCNVVYCILRGKDNDTLCSTKSIKVPNQNENRTHHLQIDDSKSYPRS